MEIRILGCFGGALPGHRTTNFLVNGVTAIDAGALVYALDFEEQKSIRHVLLTHAHLDHTVSLPFLIDNVFGEIDHAIEVYSIPQVIDSIQRHLFNDETWPDFSVIPDFASSYIRFNRIEPGETLELEGVRYTAVPVNHIVPCVGYVIEDDDASVVFTSDTGPCPGIYEAANAARNLKALITEVSFPNRLQEVATLSRHLTANTFREELEQLRSPDAQVLLYHLKPPYIDEIHSEIAELGNPRVRCLDQDARYNF